MSPGERPAQSPHSSQWSPLAPVWEKLLEREAYVENLGSRLWVRALDGGAQGWATTVPGLEGAGGGPHRVMGTGVSLGLPRVTEVGRRSLPSPRPTSGISASLGWEMAVFTHGAGSAPSRASPEPQGWVCPPL